MTTEAMILLRAENIEERQSHFSKPRAIGVLNDSHIGPHIRNTIPAAISSHPRKAQWTIVQNCMLSQADTVLSNDA